MSNREKEVALALGLVDVSLINQRAYYTITKLGSLILARFKKEEECSPVEKRMRDFLISCNSN